MNVKGSRDAGLLHLALERYYAQSILSLAIFREPLVYDIAVCLWAFEFRYHQRCGG